MKTRPVLVTAVLLVLTAVVAAIAVAVVHDDARGYHDPWGRPGSAMGRMMSGTALTEPEYLTEMISHHREAVVAAEQLSRSDRPQMRALGESIVVTQTRQIEQMTTWLQEWYPGWQEPDHYRPMMSDLSGLTGDRLDRTFLREMIRHHMAAIMMSQRLLVHGVVHEQVAALAESIRDDQHAEVLTMRRWLARWFGAGWFGTPGMMGGPAW